MKILIERKALPEIETDALVLLGFEGTPPAMGAAALIQELYDSGEFSGKSLESAILHRPAGLKAKRLVLAGAGKRDRFDSAELRKLIGATLRTLKAKSVHSITLVLDEAFRSDEFGAAAVEGALLADLEADRYKTDPKKDEKYVDSFAVTGISEAGLARGVAIAESQNFARALANEPANVLTPLCLAEKAKEMAAEQKLELATT